MKFTPYKHDDPQKRLIAWNKLLELCQQPGFSWDEYTAIERKYYCEAEQIDESEYEECKAPLCRYCICHDVLNDDRLCPRCIRDMRASRQIGVISCIEEGDSITISSWEL